MGHVETVQAIYESFARGDVPAILERLAEDVEWDPDSTDHGVPHLQHRRGKAAVAEFFASLGDTDFRRFEPVAFLAGDNQVAAVIRVELVARRTGREVRDLEVHLWTFDGSGRVAALRHFLDTHQHVTAFAEP